MTSLYRQVRLARLWLPLAIIGVVLLHQLLIVPLGGETWRFWAQLLFYSILGPAVTFITLDWIASEVRERERAQDELARLYRELSASLELLQAIQRVTERFVASPDLEAVLHTASQGIAEAAGAEGAAALLGTGPAELRSDLGLGAEALGRVRERHAALLAGARAGEQGGSAPEDPHLLSAPISWGGRVEGSVHALFAEAPGSEQRETFAILVAELSAAAEATSARTRDLITLFEVDRSIRAEGNLERLLGSLLERMMARVAARCGTVYLSDDEGLLHLQASHGLSRGAGSTVLRPGQGLAGRVAQGREPLILERVSEADRRSGSPVMQVAGSAVALPLLSEGSLTGVVVLGHPDEGHFDPSSLPILGLLASQVSLAVRNARAYLQSEELAIAEERARIAREIHDGVAQSLAFAALKLDLVERLLSRDQAKATAELAEVRSTIRELIKEVRRSIFALRPVDLERYGFLETLRRYLVDYGQQNAVRVELRCDEAPRLSLKAEGVLFRIFQEAMNNVAKHAAATQVTVEVGRAGDGQAFVRVSDNGRGFDPFEVGDRVTSAGGLGLRQMRERIEGRGGSFVLESQPGRGTTIFASVPE